MTSAASARRSALRFSPSAAMILTRFSRSASPDAARAVAAGVEGRVAGAAGHDVRGGAHRAGHEHRLAEGAQCVRQVRVAPLRWTHSSGGAAPASGWRSSLARLCDTSESRSRPAPVASRKTPRHWRAVGGWRGRSSRLRPSRPGRRGPRASRRAHRRVAGRVRRCRTAASRRSSPVQRHPASPPVRPRRQRKSVQ